MRLPGLSHLGDLAYVGDGGMAYLYRGSTPQWGEIAVKVPHPSASLARFERELAIMLSLRGQDPIVQVYDGRVGDRAASSYMVMEWVPYPTLDQVRGGSRGGEPLIEWPKVAAIGHQVCEALRGAYRAAGVRAHRDIKPNNIFADLRSPRPGRVKLADFGIAAPTEPSSLTQHLILGRPEYIAPERTRPGADAYIDERADVFSLGAVLYECLAGVPPFTGETAWEILGAVLAGNPRPLTAHCPGLDREASDVIMRCLAFQPESRWTVAELSQALAPAAEAEYARLEAAEAGPNRGPGNGAPQTSGAGNTGLLAAGAALLSLGFTALIGLPLLLGLGLGAGTAATIGSMLGVGLPLLGGGAALLALGTTGASGSNRRGGAPSSPAPTRPEPLHGGSGRSPDGAARASLEVLSGPASGRVPIGERGLICGRDASADVRLAEDDLATSREHAVVRPDGDGYVLENRGANGTRVNDVLVTHERRLRDGDRLRMGRTEARFRDGASEPAGGAGYQSE